jgi:hypothetical protein
MWGFLFILIYQLYISYIIMINFEKIVFFTSMLIAICAASFSIYGIGLLFSGAAVAAMIMASTLELGKLVTTSWLFKNWKIANMFMKTYMIFAVIVLMGITSLGVFGYLTSAYQKSSLENEMREEKIKTLSSTIEDRTVNVENYQNEIRNLYISKQSYEERLNNTLTNALIARNPIQFQTIQGQINSQIEQVDNKISEISSKIETSNKEISESDENILQIKIEQSEQKDITTFKFVAEEFGTGINTIAKWFIFLIIAVFDPLAVILLMAANMNFLKNKDSVVTPEVVEPKVVEPKVVEPEPEVVEPEPEPEVVEPEPEPEVVEPEVVEPEVVKPEPEPEVEPEVVEPEVVEPEVVEPEVVEPEVVEPEVVEPEVVEPEPEVMDDVKKKLNENIIDDRLYKEQDNVTPNIEPQPTRRQRDGKKIRGMFSF